ncbi:MAG: hypothetical protein COX79_05265 [Candidatus Levybacteria bacterium CG_4_10_14_0_2_um_filter_36_16]|nr:MAG: hypothetical protein AUK12_03685 [Candidatus Levybacteria bacterium CG2_30_37_29]PIR79241.1 MAG: hypothetical protein COU26_02215 [Candidatus Levybacteria bacterium CG10_big_fil_rev_8_21_14_0_10_36_30]PIZ96419.1 MAG: hypothetical protein COX79_05265 [Candidatus Levybacteria bacterium CG_4_10_14_0_2_um_filter_36_16]PJA90762.1 MAG: hypothetical protein CO136_00765 [Candidatus Levybacteria bacterium CG_4_9_14_3_um_filter_36_7]
MNKQKLIISSAYAAIITIAFVVIITIWAELSVPLKDWLKNFSGHHWTSKSIFAIDLYAISTAMFYLLPQKHPEGFLRRSLNSLFVVTLLGVVIITLFFTAHNFKLL